MAKSSPAPIPFARSMLRQHRHVCAFFSSPTEEYDTLLPFICDGLNCGQRAYHVLPPQYRAEHLQRLRNAGIDVEAVQRNRQLEVAVPEEKRPLRQGRHARAHPGVAQGGHSTWLPADSHDRPCGNRRGRLVQHEWVEYQMRLNEVLPRYEVVDEHGREIARVLIGY